MQYEAIVIGVSAGGLAVLSDILSELPVDFAIPVIIVQHRFREERDLLEEIMQEKCRIRIKQADEKEKIEGKSVYFAPADYHLLIEKDRSFSLTRDTPVNFSRPSIDVLFEAASEVYGPKLVGVILTGTGKDGASGIQAIRQRGGLTIAQDPSDALFRDMPKAAINTGSVQFILNGPEIKDLLLDIGKK